MKKAIVAGHICLDITPYFPNAIDLKPGRLYEVGKASFATGGVVSNTGLTMHILGTPMTLMTKIGDDSYGRQISAMVADMAPGLEAGFKVDPSVDTSYTTILNIPGIDRIFLHCPGANASYCSADVDWAAVAETDLFHFGYPSFMAAMYANGASELLTMFRKAKSLGATTSLDPGMPDASGPAGKVNWKQVLIDLLPSLDVFMPSADELLYMLAPEKFGQGDNLTADELTSLGAQLLAMGAGVVAIKLGHRGMYICTAGAERLAAMGRGKPEDAAAWANREMWFPIFKEACFKSATGAGDSSIGAFLSTMLRGLPLEEAGMMAAAVGACNVEAASALGGIQTWEATRKRMADGWEIVPFTVDAAGWRQNPKGYWEK